MSRVARVGIVHLFNGLKGLGVSSCRRLGSGFYWRPRFPGTRQYASIFNVDNCNIEYFLDR